MVVVFIVAPPFVEQVKRFVHLLSRLSSDTKALIQILCQFAGLLDGLCVAPCSTVDYAAAQVMSARGFLGQASTLLFPYDHYDNIALICLCRLHRFKDVSKA